MTAYCSSFFFFFLRTLSIYRSTHHMELDTELFIKYKYHRNHKKILFKNILFSKIYFFKYSSTRLSVIGSNIDHCKILPFSISNFYLTKTIQVVPHLISVILVDLCFNDRGPQKLPMLLTSALPTNHASSSGCQDYG